MFSSYIFVSPTYFITYLIIRSCFPCLYICPICAEVVQVNPGIRLRFWRKPQEFFRGGLHQHVKIVPWTIISMWLELEWLGVIASETCFLKDSVIVSLLLAKWQRSNTIHYVEIIQHLFVVVLLTWHPELSMTLDSYSISLILECFADVIPVWRVVESREGTPHIQYKLKIH